MLQTTRNLKINKKMCGNKHVLVVSERHYCLFLTAICIMLQSCRQAGSSQKYRFCVHLFVDQIENSLIESKVLTPSMDSLSFFLEAVHYNIDIQNTAHIFFFKLFILCWGTTDSQTM